MIVNEKGIVFFFKLRRPLLSIPRMQDECRGRQGARLSTTRRSIQPKNKAVDRGVYVCMTLNQIKYTLLSPCGNFYLASATTAAQTYKTTKLQQGQLHRII